MALYLQIISENIFLNVDISISVDQFCSPCLLSCLLLSLVYVTITARSIDEETVMRDILSSKYTYSI